MFDESKPWFIMFHAPWCEHCFKLIRFWERVAEKYYKTINFGEVECEENEDLRDHFSISVFPSFIYYPNATTMHTFIGYRNMENITDWIEKEIWKEKIEHSEPIPKKINYQYRLVRRLFHPISVIHHCY